MTLNWASDDAMMNATMIPMDEPSWESILALPQGTEVAAVFVAPFGVAIRTIHFHMTEHNRARIAGLRASGNSALPAYCTYVLPPVEVPNPEDFLATEETHRKDADNE